MIHRKLATALLLVLTFGLGSLKLHADEGMWLFTDLPSDQLKSRYGFTMTDEWAQHVMLSSVRFNSGGSASFVSSTGLVLTNHHVASDTLQKLSTPEHNYIEDGFYAPTHAQEVAAPDLELNQLVSIEDVTAQVNAAVPAGASVAEAAKARRAVMSEIEQKSLDATGFRSDVVTLFGGAKYHLYRYKKYTDVRLVWAPETKAAFFGGDADNFEYPRYCLDVTLFRVYEDGKPAKIDHFLKFDEAGVQNGDLVFVSGNPGRTQRIFTLDALKYLRDHRLPYVLDYLRRLEVLLQQYSYEGEEQKRRARNLQFGIQNSRKAYTGMIQGLQNPSFLEKKAKDEAALLKQIKASPELKDYASAWEEVAAVQKEKAELLGHSASFGRISDLYHIAETLVHMAAEDKKPSEERMREYRDSARESLEQALYSPAPIYPDFETVLLADQLALFSEKRGGDDPLVQKVLAGKSPLDRAAELVQGSQLIDIDQRKKMAANPALHENDPLMQLVKILEPEFRRLHELSEELDERERQAYARITEAVVAIQGTNTYPDATFTLRLAYGSVKGYEEAGQTIAPFTNMGGAFEHEAAHNSELDWKLPQSWHDHKSDIALDTRLNFVSTCDIIGGNSGSPVINAKGELVGIIFDGNIQSLTGDFFYSDTQSRAVSVHAHAVREALKSIYGAGALANELGK
ncbi:MAG: S46 family peptidase [Planctomycetaceae bacterium]